MDGYVERRLTEVHYSAKDYRFCDKFLAILIAALLLVIMPYLHIGFAIKCYYCDNSVSPACGQEFKAYQFEATVCPDDHGRRPICGKQEQPPDRNGWTGVIRSCYYPGDLPGLNDSVGCHQYFHDQNNFSALYCFCNSSYCNGAQSAFTLSVASVFFITASALAFSIPHTV